MFINKKIKLINEAKQLHISIWAPQGVVKIDNGSTCYRRAIVLEPV
jgi:hypothetical protein